MQLLDASWGPRSGMRWGCRTKAFRAKRAARLLGPPDRYRFFLRHGMVSDDTEHTCMVAQSMIDAGGDVPKFTRTFARRLRWWILGLPAGVGKATARSGIKLWLGASPEKAGVFSAGNGPAMRAAIFGAALNDVPSISNFVRASSRLTHSDPKAEYGAIAVALAAKHSRDNATVEANLWLDEVVDAVGEGGAELIDLLRQAIRSVEAGETTQIFANSLGLDQGVTGYTYHTVPMAIHAWLSNPKDFRKAVTSIIECGGDADTTAAIVGGIVGAGVGRDGIPNEWLDGIWEWPRSVAWMQRLGETLADSLEGDRSVKSPTVNPIAVLLRNLLFLFIVLFHGFRRLAPPY